MKYPFPIFEYPPIIQDSLTIFVYKTVRNTTISLKDVNSEKKLEKSLRISDFIRIFAT